MRLAALAVLLAFAGPARAADECRARFSIPAVLRDTAAGKPVPESLRWELLAYYKWTAFAKDDPAACAPLKSLSFALETAGAPVSGDALCRDLLVRLAFVRGYAAGAKDLPRLCREDVASLARGRPRDADMDRRFQEACGYLSRPDLAPKDFCSKAVALLPFPERMREKEGRRCVCDFESLRGSRVCHDAPDNDAAGFLGPYRYDAFAALHAALAAKDPERCGELELCRGLAGQAAAMARRRAARAADAACGGALR